MNRLYEVTFNQYTDSSRDAVHNKETDNYLITPEPIIIKEEQIPFMKDWGGGINTLKYVGVLAFEYDIHSVMDKKGGGQK